MLFDLQEGIKESDEIVVEDGDTARKYESGDLDVYATPAMIRLMEKVAKNCVGKCLPEGYTTVGIEMNVKHMKATPVGMRVRCEAQLSKIDGKKLYFEVTAWDENGMIGQGNHIRYIVDAVEFVKRAYSK